MKTQNTGIRPLTIVLLVVLTAVASVAGTLWIQGRLYPAASKADPSHEDVLADINRQVQKLAPDSPTYTPLYAKAMTARHAILADDFTTATAITGATLKNSHMGSWHFAPFSKLIGEIDLPANDNFLQHLNRWAAVDNKNAMPYLLRAHYYFYTAWKVRGNRYARYVEQEDMDTFEHDLQLAAEDAKIAMQLDRNNPFAAYVKLEIARAGGNTPHMEDTFQQTIKLFPHYYPLYQLRLSSLIPRWGGSIREMYDFVDTYAGKSSAYSPKKMLYLELYYNILRKVHAGCDRNTGNALTHCINRGMTALITPALSQQVYSLFQNYQHYDLVAYSNEVGGNLQSIIEIEGAEQYSGPLLQLAASSMGSNNELSATDTSKNNFMMDELTALIWKRRGHKPNAITLYKRAISDLSHTHFSNQEARDNALGDLYDDLAGVYFHNQNFREVAIYERASEKLYGMPAGDDGVWVCASFERLKLYDEALKTCSSLVAKNNMSALFYRGWVYMDMKQWRKSADDFIRVADSESSRRSMAAVEAGYVYGEMHDFKKQLAVLNKYQFIYDEDLDDRADIAIAYNNRCYAKLHLNMLESALKDCTASLRYGNLPDAYKKQQQLVKMLAARKNQDKSSLKKASHKKTPSLPDGHPAVGV